VKGEAGLANWGVREAGAWSDAAVGARRAEPAVQRRWLPKSRWGWALLYICLVYAVSILVAPVDGFYTPDEGAKFVQMLNVRWTGAGFGADVPYPDRELDPGLQLPAIGVGSDPDLRVLGMFSYSLQPNGTLRTYFPLAFAVLSRAMYLPFGLRGLLILPALGGLLTVLFAGLIVEEWRPGRGWLGLLATAFATPVLFYSQAFWEHTPALAPSMAGLWVLVRVQRSAPSLPRRLGAYGLALGLVGLASVFRVEMLLVELCCVLWCAAQLARSGPAGRAAVAGLAAAGGGLFWVVARNSGYLAALNAIRVEVQTLILSNLADPAKRSLAPLHLWERLYQAFYNVPQAGALVISSMAYLTIAGVALALAARFAHGDLKPPLLALASAAMALPVALIVLHPGAVNATHGIVLAMPLMLAAFAWAGRKLPAEGLFSGLTLALIAAEVVFLDRGTAYGPEWGARGILLIYPLAAILAVVHWPGRDGAPGYLRVALAGLVGLSTAMQLRGLVQLRVDDTTAGLASKALERLQPSLVLTDVWWLPSVATPGFAKHEVAAVYGPTEAAVARFAHDQAAAQSRPVVFATTCSGICPLPPAIARYFDQTSVEDTAGLFVAHLRPR
jgi:hypothetical protein